MTSWATPHEYLEIMLDAGCDADAWETTYQQLLPGENPVLEWVRGTGLRPVLAALSAEDAAGSKPNTRRGWPRHTRPTRTAPCSRSAGSSPWPASGNDPQPRIPTGARGRPTCDNGALCDLLTMAEQRRGPLQSEAASMPRLSDGGSVLIGLMGRLLAAHKGTVLAIVVLQLVQTTAKPPPAHPERGHHR